MHSRVGSTMAANRPTRRRLISTPRKILATRGIKHSNGWPRSVPVGSTGFGLRASAFGLRSCLPFLGCLNHRASWTTAKDRTRHYMAVIGGDQKPESEAEAG